MDTTEAIKQLLVIVNDLRITYKDKNKRFTLDGRLVGDLGEIIVAENYDVDLYDQLIEKYDGEDSLNRKVQIKATFNDSLGFPCNANDVPDYYIGIKILSNGSFIEIYNGPGITIWEKVKNRKPTKNSLHSISNSMLSELNKTIENGEKIAKKVI